jgi:thioredoxin-like negative regulator of GroEL
MSDYPHLVALLDQVEAAVTARDIARVYFEADHTPDHEDAFEAAEEHVLDVADVALPVLVTVVRGFLEMKRPALREFLARIERELGPEIGGLR